MYGQLSLNYFDTEENLKTEWFLGKFCRFFPLGFMDVFLRWMLEIIISLECVSSVRLNLKICASRLFVQIWLSYDSNRANRVLNVLKIVYLDCLHELRHPLLQLQLLCCWTTITDVIFRTATCTCPFHLTQYLCLRSIPIESLCPRSLSISSFTLIFNVQILDHPLYNFRTWNERKQINMIYWHI